jgi:hypothetical protein
MVGFSFLEAREVLSRPDATPGPAGAISVDVTIEGIGSDLEFVTEHCGLL